MQNNFSSFSGGEELRSNYAEYLVKYTGKKAMLIKSAIIAGAVVAIMLAFFMPFMSALFIPVIIGIMALVWYFWRFTQLEYEYIIISSTVEFYRIFGESYRKKLLEIKTSDIEKVASVHAHPEVMNAEYAEIYDYSDGKHAEDCFYIIYNGEKGRSIIYINVIKKTLDVFRHYRPSCVEYGNIK